jgi:glucosamine--fructose-6-phosphate aminotransferase (isomerizing)
VVTKYASIGDNADSIDLVRAKSEKLQGHSVGIAHTRWATHGGKTDPNAHPHVDSSGKIALVHNGTIDNANELRKQLQDKGHVFTSQTDTEVIAKLVGDIYAEGKLSLKDAVEETLSHLSGTWGLAVMSTDEPDLIVVARHGSPLVIGLSDECTFVASETTAFSRYTQSFISVGEGEIGELHADQRKLDMTRCEIAPEWKVELHPDPHPHWTIKECLEQPVSISRALGFGSRLGPDGLSIVLGGLDANKEKLSKIRHLTFSACGTSLYAAKFGERLMKELGIFDSVSSIDAAETESKDFPSKAATEQSGLIVVSQSGETRDVYNVVREAMSDGVTVMSVINTVGSLIARSTKLGVYIGAGRECAVASTKAFTSQVTVLALMALWFRQLRNKTDKPKYVFETAELREALLRLPLSIGMALRNRAPCKAVAERLKDKDHCFILGKGLSEPIALEGALKLKEMGYLHAEGFSGGALKHGPFALIEGKEGKNGATPIIMIILSDKHSHLMRTAAEEVKARGAEVIIITDKPSLAHGLDDHPIVIPSNGPLTALCAVIPLQLIAYELACLKYVWPLVSLGCLLLFWKFIAWKSFAHPLSFLFFDRGINPDTPRNLAKAVTVD